MPPNFPGEYEVEIRYTVSSLEHTQRLNCDVVSTPTPGDLPATIDLKTRGGGSVQLDTAVLAWVASLTYIFRTDVTFDDFTFWKYDVGTFDKTFISTGIIGDVGDNAGATNLGHQWTFTFRTLEGGAMRIVLLETTSTNKVSLSYPQLDNDSKAVMDFIIGTSNWILARDTSYPIAYLHVVGGENERTFESRYR